jgi:hypothetical protein
MNLLFIPRKESVLSVYDEIVKVYRGKEHYLFDVLCSIVTTFSRPDDSRYYSSALNAFRVNLNFTSIVGLSRLLKIIEGLVTTTYDDGDSFILECLVPKLRFITNDSATEIVFNEKNYFAAEWNVPVSSFGQDEQQIIQLDLFDYQQNEIVPSYIVEYVKGAVLLYSQGLLKGACALMTIAMEATLRDILATRGYSYVTGTSSDDQYAFANAVVDVNAERDKFTISFAEGNIRSITEYCTANSLTTSQNIRIRRKKYGRDGKFELSIRNCDSLIDYFSPNVVDTPGQKTISGLGAALDIARNREEIIEVSLLPQDMDIIFTGIRNNLIHLSGEGLSTAHVQDQNLEEFVNDRNKVFDLISFVPQFINAKYRELNQ